jgi:uncharacterized protein (TIGR02996 family)
MSATRDGLLQDIIANPDDDTPRLVYADWLDENGQEARAEFIRLQIHRERLPKKDRRRLAPEPREKKLAANHAREWLAPLPEWARLRGDDLIALDDVDINGFRRGFLQGVIAPTADIFLKEAPSAFATEPITHLYTGDAGFLTRMRSSAEFLSLVGLRFSHYTLGDEGAVILSRLPVMPRLRFLWLYKQEMGDRGLRALARWPGLATVRELQLGFNQFRATGVKALIASPHLESLKELYLGYSGLADKSKQALRERFGRVLKEC